jgi:hypothetical protein
MNNNQYLPPWFFMPQQQTGGSRRRRGNHMPPPGTIDDWIESLKKWQSYQEDLKLKEKKPEEKKPTGFEKFQAGVAHLGYLVILGIPTGLIFLGGYSLLLRGAASIAGAK